MANDEFGKGNCDKDKIRILPAFSISKKSIEKGYLTFGTKTGNKATKKDDNNARSSEYLFLDAKKVLNLL